MSIFQLYAADAIDLMRSLPDESIDLIVTDVAYESLEKHRSKGTTTRLKKSAASSNEWFPIFGNERFAEFFAESFRVLKKDAHLYFYCDPETAFIAKPEGEKAGFKFWKPIVWAKTKQGVAPDADDLDVGHQAIGLGYHLRASYEFILFFEKGKRKISDLGVRDLLPFPTVRNGYPTQKPVELNRVLVRISSLPGETVLDPFMGSGSAGVAAVRNGRHFIGGDIEHTAVADVERVLKSEGADARGDTVVIPVSTDRPARPEPPLKKTRAKKAPAVGPTIFDEDDLRAPPPGETTPCEHSFMGKPRMCGKCGARDVKPPVTTDAPLPPIGALEPPHDYDGSLDALESEPPRRRAYAFANGKVQGEVPNVMFDVKVSDAPLPPPPTVSAIEQLEAAFAGLDTALAFDGKPGPEPQLDGQFMTGPLPGGPTRHLSKPNLIPPPRPEKCQHGDVRSACILCRARR